jgi:uncharacterized cupredoxin-like copper-binding protein
MSLLGAMIVVALMGGGVIGTVALNHGLRSGARVTPWHSSEVSETLSDYSIEGGTTAPAGDVTFVVFDGSSSLSHELVVLKTDTPFDKLPVVDSGDPPAPVKTGADKVDEAANVGETGDPNLVADEVRTFTIRNMAPGHYVLLCNLPGHYAMGMRAPFTVTP